MRLLSSPKISTSTQYLPHDTTCVNVGFGLGAFFSLMSSTFAYEDPLSRTWAQDNMSTRQKTAVIFKDMGKNMVKSGKGFGKVGALYAGVECVIEGVSPCLLP